MGKSNALRKNIYSFISGSAALLFLIPAFVLPVGITLSEAGEFADILKDEYYRSITLFTLKQAALSTALSLAIGLPAAWLTATREFTGRRFLKAVSAIPFSLPSIVAVLGFVVFYGNSGFLARILGHSPGLLYNFTGVLLAHAFYNFPVVMNIVSSYWETLDTNQEYASATMGAGPVRTFLEVTSPRLILPVLSSAVLVFLYCFSSFAVILVLGGGPAYSTLEVEIYRYARISLDLSKAASLAIISMLLTVMLLTVHSFLQKKLQAVQSSRPPVRRKPRSVAEKILIYLFAALLVLFILAPVLSVVVCSFTASASRTGGAVFSTQQYSRINLTAVADSLLIALSSALLALILSLSIGRLIAITDSTLLEITAMSPMAVSSVIIGFGYFLIKMNLKIRYPALLVISAHAVLALPFSLRTLLPALRCKGKNQLNAAKTMQCSPARAFFEIELPSIRTQLLTALTFSFALSAGEVSAALTLSDGSVPTLPVEIYRAIASYNYRTAAASASVLILISVSVFLIKEFRWHSN